MKIALVLTQTGTLDKPPYSLAVLKTWLDFNKIQDQTFYFNIELHLRVKRDFLEFWQKDAHYLYKEKFLHFLLFPEASG